MRRITRALLIAGLSIAAVLGGATAAFAGTMSINYIMYPSSAYNSNVNGNLTWIDGGVLDYSGTVYDEDSDGHGPYLHIIAHNVSTVGNATQNRHVVDVHNTYGYGTGKNFSGEYDAVSDFAYSYRIQYVDVWICIGGDVNGNSPYGCYGRRAYNHTFNNDPSDSLGTTYGAVY